MKVLLSSNTKILAKAIPHIHDTIKKYQEKIHQPLFTVFLTSNDSTKQLTMALSRTETAFSQWLLISKNFCFNPEEFFPPFNVKIEVLAICNEKKMHLWQKYSNQFAISTVSTRLEGVRKILTSSFKDKYSLHGAILRTTEPKVSLTW